MNSAAEPSRRPERVLLAAGTAVYAHSEVFQALDKVPAALTTVVRSLRELGTTPIAPDTGYLLNPDLDVLKKYLKEAAQAAPIVIFYYTGHGIGSDLEPYFIATHASDPDDLLDSALRASDLPLRLRIPTDMAVESGQPEVLIILDCCFSSAGGEETLVNALRHLGNPNAWVLATAGAVEYAAQGVFADALAQVLRDPRIGSSSPFISIMSLMDEIQQRLKVHGTQRAQLFAPGGSFSRTPPFFPNPRYLPGAAGMTVEGQQHWLSRVRGGPEAMTTGFYLTGRSGRIQAAEDLATWMSDPGQEGLAVVTGSPGAGKSTLLALAVLLTTPEGRDTLVADSILSTSAGWPVDRDLVSVMAELLPVDSPVVSAHAHGLTTDQIARRVAEGLGRTVNTTTSLLEDLDSIPLDTQVVLVVDAVDEASTPGILVRSLLVPLGHQPGIKVVLGARPHVLEAVRQRAVTIDLDSPRYQDKQALTDYVALLLSAAREPGVRTPYQVAAEASSVTVSAVAAAIAERATTSLPRSQKAESFLLGRLLALAVRGRPSPVDTTDPGWLGQLPDTVGDAFDEDLARLGDRAQMARVLLETLAWSRGTGMPWEVIWVPVAAALARESGYTAPVSDDDVKWLLGTCGSYVVEDLMPGHRSVFRPFHELLARHLRTPPDRDADSSATDNSRRDERIEASITAALIGTVPVDLDGVPAWDRAHPYLRSHLAEHAHAAGPETLAGLLITADFLAAADPATLAPLLPLGGDQASDIARVYRRARPVLGGNTSDNVAHLREAAAGIGSLSTRAVLSNGHIPALYRTALAAVSLDNSHLTLTGHIGGAESVAFWIGADGRPLLASAGQDETVRLWDPATGAQVGEPLTGHTDGVLSVAFGICADGRPLLASGGQDGTVRLWDPATVAQVGEPLTGHTDWVSSVAFGIGADGRPLLASGGRDGTVRLWDPATRAPVGELLTGHTIGLASVAFGTGTNGRALLAYSAHRNMVVCDSATGSPIGEPLIGHTDWVTSLAFGTGEDGRALLASAGEDRTVRLWDPGTGAPVGEPLTGHTDGVLSVAFGTGANGRALLASAGRDGTARLWDPATGGPVGGPLIGHTRFVSSVAFGTGADGRPLLVSGGQDNVRLWDLATATPVGGQPTGHANGAMSVAFGTGANGRPLLASASRDNTVQLWDPAAGAPVGNPLNGHTGWVSSVAFGTGADDRPLLATAGGYDHTVRLWDPATGAPVGKPLIGHTNEVSSVAFGTGADGRPLLASASHDKTVRLWDPATGAPVGEPLAAHLGFLTSVAFGTGADGHPLLASAEKDNIVLWDPQTGAPLGEPLTGHTGWVSSVAFGTDAGGRPLLASAGQDTTVRLWDPATGAQLGEPLTDHTDWVWSVAFGTDADGRLLLASGSRDGTVRLWDPLAGIHLCLTHRRTPPDEVALCNGDLLLAIADREGVTVIEFAA